MSLYCTQRLTRLLALPSPFCQLNTLQRAELGSASPHPLCVLPLQHAVFQQHAQLHTTPDKMSDDNDVEAPKKNPRFYNLYQREFVKLLQSRVDRRKVNRTMSLKDKTNPHNLKDERNIPIVGQERSYKVDIPSVDCVVGILSNSKMKRAQPADCGSEYQGQREMARNRLRTLRKVSESELYTEKDSLPIPCQYTKELELRKYRVDDKLIKFPIDNEAIVWEESHVPFTDHIFLHKYITLFPPGTHRFMETIVSALQNNPDLTVEKKKVIIWSYLNYFNFNKDLLLEDEEEVLEV